MTRQFEVSKYLETSEDVAAYLNEVFADGDPELIMAALGDVMKTRVYKEIAKKANINRVTLHKTIAQKRDPRVSTMAKVLGALGCRLAVVPNIETPNEKMAYGAGQAATAIRRNTVVRRSNVAYLEKTASRNYPMSNRDTFKYQFKIGNKIVHGGITDDLERREQEHQQEYGEKGHIKQVGYKTTEEAARKWEKDKGYS